MKKKFKQFFTAIVITSLAVALFPVAAFASVDPFPTYTGDNQCPVGSTMSTTPVMTTLVGSTDLDGVMFSLASNPFGYVFQASGTFIPTSAPGYLSDAAYTLIDNVLSTQYGIHGTDPDKGAHALLADLGSGIGILDWGTYTETHMYSKHFVLSTTSVQFAIGDRWADWYGTPYQDQSGMSDNSGSLTLNVYSCIPNDAPIGDQCKKDGWKTLYTSTGKPFKNQGDCVSYFQSNENAVANKTK